LNAQYGQVGFRVTTNDVRLILLRVVQRHEHLVSAIDDMIVREDVAVRSEDHARACATLSELRLPGHLLKKPFVEFTKWTLWHLEPWSTADLPGCSDFDMDPVGLSALASSAKESGLVDAPMGGAGLRAAAVVPGR
jgi:hypothetical protein